MFRRMTELEKGSLKGRIIANTLLKNARLLVIQDFSNVFHVLATLPSEQIEYSFPYTNGIANIILDDMVYAFYTETIFPPTSGNPAVRFRVIYRLELMSAGSERNPMLFTSAERGGQIAKGVPALFFGYSKSAKTNAANFFDAFHSRAVVPHMDGLHNYVALYGNANGIFGKNMLTERSMRDWSQAMYLARDVEKGGLGGLI